MAGKPSPPALAPFRFDSESARAAGKKSAQSRKARGIARRAAPGALGRTLQLFRDTFANPDVGGDVLVVASVVLARLALGEIPIRNGEEAASVLRVLHEIARLEAGQPTSLTASVTVGPDVALARLAELRKQAQQVIDGGQVVPSLSASASVQAVDDEPASPVVVGGEEHAPTPADAEFGVVAEDDDPYPRTAGTP
jgi:hypothetical protein